MSAGDVAAGENHHHQRRADRERGDDSGSRADYRSANRQDKKECSDEFGDILVHSYVLGQSASKKQEHQQWAVGLTTAIKHRTYNGEHPPNANASSQAANFIQINSRIIAPMIDMTIPAG